MNLQLGNYALALTLLVSVIAMFAGILASVDRSAISLRIARIVFVLAGALVLVASAVLMRALVNSDFTLEYVARYTERALPMGYKVAAFWAGQEGSLLLWLVLLTLLSLAAVFGQRREAGALPATTLATLAAVTAFFAGLILFAASPFKAPPEIIIDGMGLNPLLQDPGMIIHPPLLFMGYAGYTVPFAIFLGAMAAGRRDNQWLTSLRRWSIFAWLFLTAGIVWGGHWSYTTLGWGGYWAWDPVENASLLPWLTGTALLHSAGMQQLRGMFKRWNFALAAATFMLCLLGTYLTRSGVVSSRHAFGESSIGNFFVGAIVISLIATLLAAWIRRDELRSEHEITNIFSRESAFMIINWLLTLIMVMTLAGTVFPLLSRSIGGREITLKEDYYNHLVVPVFMALIGLMALGPIIRFGADAGAKLFRSAVLPCMIAAIIVGLTIASGITNLWALINTFLASLVIIVIVIELGKAIAQRSGSHGETYLMAFLQTIDANHRRYGAQTAHMGVALIVIGIVGSSLFSTKETPQLSPGQTMHIGESILRFNGLVEEKQANYVAVVADLVLEPKQGRPIPLRPDRRFFNKSEDAFSGVALESTLADDLYITLAGWESGGSVTAIQVIRNPLVIWIWIGGFVMAGGAMLCMLPKLIPVRVTTRVNTRARVENPSEPRDESPAGAVTRSEP